MVLIVVSNQNFRLMSKITVQDVVNFLQELAPFQLQESYDNSGLITGDPGDEVRGVLVSLDCTEEVLAEALERGCNVIVSHHPILFKPIKSLTGKNYVERTLMEAIRRRVNLIAVHTNLDKVIHGVNARIAQKLGLTNLRILSPEKGSLLKLVTFVPDSHQGQVLDALHRAGAGNIGQYDQCSFITTGTGSFRPLENANPFLGKKGSLEQVAEVRIEVILPVYARSAVLQALGASHPYEEVAYYLQELENLNQEIGSGMVGDLPQALNYMDFLKLLKINMKCQSIRHTKLIGQAITRVAICGGSGSFLLNDAIRSGAQVFVSADFKYHEFFDSDGKIMIADIGHYESEQYTGELLTEVLTQKFTTFASLFSKIVTNPISYFN